ncbi:MAG: HAD-IA family hydrolase [Pseudomonadota bacterium]
MAMQRCVLFDFDDTLANTASLREIRDTQQYDQLTPEKLAPIKLYKPVAMVLSALKDQGVAMGIVTNSGSMYVEKLLEHLGIKHFFSTVVTYGDVKAQGMKPSPAGIRLALERIGVEATTEVLFVGDTNLDFEAAYQAGVTPVLPSWASKESTSVAPAIEMSSTMLCDHFSSPKEYRLFAERCAELGTANFARQAVYFLPLDENANVVTMEDRITTLCFGRYFGQKSAVSAILHDAHALSKEIIKKEAGPIYEIPKYWFELLAHIVCRGWESVYAGGKPFDVVTVVPGKAGKDPRLERLLLGVEKITLGMGSGAKFIPNVFEYAADARSQKTLQRMERHREANRSLGITEAGVALLRNARVLVIDDVITTGATLQRARELAIEAGALSVLGAALAKTVSIAAQERGCVECGRSMFVKKNGTTGERFWSCMGFSDNLCNHTEPFYVKTCPRCGRNMRVRTNSHTKEKFWGCSGYGATPQCNFSTDFDPLESL